MGELQIFYLPMKSYAYHWGHGYNGEKLEKPFFDYGLIFGTLGLMRDLNNNSQKLTLLDYECLPTANSDLITKA